ncbi:unnamed protein product [Lactuca saligna]|uniref:Myb/SANT-like domain-containing protein n=1 Tax=Lactuca saligna TaxID=75948 RepID=A0AA36EI56_LACSI|nr:unnamed protein product [Lactuca saligna]
MLLGWAGEKGRTGLVEVSNNDNHRQGRVEKAYGDEEEEEQEEEEDKKCTYLSFLEIKSGLRLASALHSLPNCWYYSAIDSGCVLINFIVCKEEVAIVFYKEEAAGDRFLATDKGHKPDTHFNKTGWANLQKAMQEETGKVFTKKQFKNKWDNLKKDWQLYDRLMRLETGIGGTRSLLDATPEWWEEKIKVDKDFAKFRGTYLSIYETYYAPLFRD